jgi:hypothetical protein
MESYSSYVPPPNHSKNGGLYSGPEAPPGAPWAAIPVVPDVDYLIHENLKSANPPAGALYQYPGNIRPGNNFQSFPGLSKYVGTEKFGPFNFMCAPCTTDSQTQYKNNWCVSENTLNHCHAKTFVQVD